MRRTLFFIEIINSNIGEIMIFEFIDNLFSILIIILCLIAMTALSIVIIEESNAETQFNTNHSIEEKCEIVKNKEIYNSSIIEIEKTKYEELLEEQIDYLYQCKLNENIFRVPAFLKKVDKHNLNVMELEEKSKIREEYINE